MVSQGSLTELNPARHVECRGTSLTKTWKEQIQLKIPKKTVMSLENDSAILHLTLTSSISLIQKLPKDYVSCFTQIKSHLSTQRLLWNRKSIKNIAANLLRPCKYAFADHEQIAGKKERKSTSVYLKL